MKSLSSPHLIPPASKPWVSGQREHQAELALGAISTAAGIGHNIRLSELIYRN
jgi:hypothetical protein